MSVSALNNAGGINFEAAIASGDIQTIIQMVQGERVKLLDAQLVDQVKAVQQRNDQISKLNNALSALTAYEGQIDGTDAGSKPKDWTAAKINQYELSANDAIAAAGITDLGFTSRTGQRTPVAPETKDGNEGKLITGTNVVCGSTTKGEIDAAITKIKGLIDAESNNQQMDMLRLQSLSNKKDESIELLTNTQKKTHDSSSGIIQNI